MRTHSSHPHSKKYWPIVVRLGRSLLAVGPCGASHFPETRWEEPHTYDSESSEIGGFSFDHHSVEEELAAFGVAEGTYLPRPYYPHLRPARTALRGK